MMPTTVLLLALVVSAPPRGAEPARAAPAPTASATAAVTRAKRTFRTAVDLCATPGRCDSSKTADRDLVDLLATSERQFLVACQACAAEERCEAEAKRIRDGKRSPGATPCE